MSYFLLEELLDAHCTIINEEIEYLIYQRYPIENIQ